MRYSVKKLKNNLTVLTVPSSEAESVVVDFFVKTGSRSEKPEEHGMAHFLEHFLFKGSKHYPTAMAISELVDAIGGEMNANTGKEHTQFYIKAHSKYLPLIFEILSDMIQNPLFNENELAREKGVIVEELNMYKDAPMYEVDNILEEEMFSSHPLGRRIVGSKETVTAFTPEMFRAFMDRYYQTGNMILAVSGKYDGKVLNNLIKQHWGEVKNKKFGTFEGYKAKQEKPKTVLQFKQTEQAHFILSFVGLSYNDKLNPVQSVMSAVLGGGMSSRLFTEVREKRGLAYYVRAGGYNHIDTGMFNVSAGVQVDKIEEAIKVVLLELNNLCKVLVPQKELLKAKNYIIGKTTLALEDNQARMDWYLDQVAFHKTIDAPKTYFKDIQKVTSQDIQKLAKKIFDINQSTLAVIGPYKDQKKFESLLV